MALRAVDAPLPRLLSRALAFLVFFRRAVEVIFVDRNGDASNPSLPTNSSLSFYRMYTNLSLVRLCPSNVRVSRSLYEGDKMTKEAAPSV